MASNEWTSIRVRKGTLAALRQELARLNEAVTSGRVVDPEVSADHINPAVVGMSLDALILRMLGQRRRQKERAAESRKRSRRKKGGES